MTDHIQKLCATLDSIDSAPFGEVNKLLDSAATDGQLAIVERRFLIQALEKCAEAKMPGEARRIATSALTAAKGAE